MMGVHYCILIQLNSKYLISATKGNSVMLLTNVVLVILGIMSGGTQYEKLENHWSSLSF